MKNKEIEITYVVTNAKALEKTLLGNGAILQYERILDRDIYENNRDFFIRYSTEVQDNITKKFFTMKSDGDMNSVNKVKEKIEIEFPINDEQEEGLKAVFEALKFEKTNSYRKERKAYTLFDCDLSIDTMENKTYFEIEFENENDMKKIVKLVDRYLEEK
ncbi:MAG: hypothetical protein ACOX06_03015 [Candidatus Dojkabacteria bacterium]|jgi:adenylate cyclase class IV